MPRAKSSFFSDRHLRFIMNAHVPYVYSAYIVLYHYLVYIYETYETPDQVQVLIHVALSNIACNIMMLYILW